MDLGNPEKLDVFFTGKEAESFSSPIPQNIYQLFLIFYFVGRLDYLEFSLDLFN